MSEAEKIGESAVSETKNTETNVVHIAPAKSRAPASTVEGVTGTTAEAAATPATLAKPTTSPTTLKPPSWKSRLQKKGKVLYKPNFSNATTTLRHAPEWANALRFNEFSGTVLLDRAPPWMRKEETASWESREWSNFDSYKLTEWFQLQGIDLTKNLAIDAALTIACERKFHPVREWFASLVWDEVPRLSRWLITYLGAEDREFERCVGPKYVISAVARIMKPGCKADCVLMLVGEQGQGKSTALVMLVGEKWFTDEVGALSGDKDTPIAMAGKLLVEFSDLEGFKGKSADELKAFLSRRVDRYRGVFERLAEDHPRQTIFAATTNQQTPLKDFTGNRRFWPVTTSTMDLKGLDRDRDQLWAEAVHRYRSGELWYLDTPEERALADSIAEEFREPNSWEEIIAPELVGRDQIRMAEVLTQLLDIPEGKITREHEMRASAAMKGLGWERKKNQKKGDKGYAYHRPVAVKPKETVT